MKSYLAGFLAQPQVQAHIYDQNIMKVAIVIEAHYNLNSLSSVLEDIRKQKLYQTKIDIYVVHNALDEFTQAYLQKFDFTQITFVQPEQKLADHERLYYGLQFVSKLEYDYIWLIDSDVRLDPLALTTLITTLQEYNEVGLVCSQVYERKEPKTIQEFGNFINGNYPQSTTNVPKQNNILGEELLHNKAYIQVEYCAAKSLLLPYQVVQHLGVCQDFGLNFKSTDLCMRVQKAGWIIAVNPSSIIWQNSPDLELWSWINCDNKYSFYYWEKYRPDLF
ncbi:glycosyltransferase family 2 protein [Anabaena sp. CS-542/02]|uniref:glycosyltransferase family 2 protein n=1 Tax=Anabaena sp. CS-542/02 TaxID=3021719 RepID=UPI00232ED4AC|nr:glycosyltransferase [Anabaena sp. CS-542/02]MDB9446007.1 glycosyltransferase [Anabaena sp. CS-542/02]